MGDGANHGSDKCPEEVKAALHADALKLISQLDSEIAELRRLAPPGSDDTIENLREALDTIRDAISRSR